MCRRMRGVARISEFAIVGTMLLTVDLSEVLRQKALYTKGALTSVPLHDQNHDSPMAISRSPPYYIGRHHHHDYRCSSRSVCHTLWISATIALPIYSHFESFLVREVSQNRAFMIPKHNTIVNLKSATAIYIADVQFTLIRSKPGTPSSTYYCQD